MYGDATVMLPHHAVVFRGETGLALALDEEVPRDSAVSVLACELQLIGRGSVGPDLALAVIRGYASALRVLSPAIERPAWIVPACLLEFLVRQRLVKRREGVLNDYPADRGTLEPDAFRHRIVAPLYSLRLHICAAWRCHCHNLLRI